LSNAGIAMAMGSRSSRGSRRNLAGVTDTQSDGCAGP
jgi:hypothetical protein